MSTYIGTKLVAGRIAAPTGAMVYRGSCLQSDLPTSGQQKGDYWKLTDTSGQYAGQCAIWNGTTWDYSSSSIEVDSDLSTTSTNPVENKVITAAINSKVGLTGDETIAGNKTFSSTILISAADAITRNDTNSAIRIHGGTIGKGARILLAGKDEGSYPGSFLLDANNGTTNKRFLGKPDGTLTWDGKSIATELNSLPCVNEGLNGQSRTSLYNTLTDGSAKVFARTTFQTGEFPSGGTGTTYTVFAFRGSEPFGGMYAFHQGTGHAYLTMRNGSTTWSTWTDLTNTVYLTGNQSIAGDKTFTGNLIVNNTIKFPGNTCFASTVDNWETGFYGGTGYNLGARLILGGKSRSSNPGSFLLDANNGSVTKRLEGYPSGSLKWDGNEVATTNNTVNLTGDQTIAGDKTFSGAVLFNGSGQIKNSVDTGKVLISGSSDQNNGASVILQGKDYTDAEYKGTFVIMASDGTNLVHLIGKPNGTLTWAGKNVTVPSSDGTVGQVLQSNGTGTAPSWVNIAGGTAKYQHNICASDSTTTMVNFSFINSVPDAYTTNEDVSLALYNLGFTEARKSMAAAGTVYSLVYGTATGNFYYWKTNESKWNNGGWNQITDTVVEC